jgi:hypothetical protein
MPISVNRTCAGSGNAYSLISSNHPRAAACASSSDAFASAVVPAPLTAARNGGSTAPRSWSCLGGSEPNIPTGKFVAISP